jgi:hypothetical protein
VHVLFSHGAHHRCRIWPIIVHFLYSMMVLECLSIHGFEPWIIVTIKKIIGRSSNYALLIGIASLCCHSWSVTLKITKLLF